MMKKNREFSGIKTLIANAGGDEAEKLIDKQRSLLEQIKKT